MIVYHGTSNARAFTMKRYGAAFLPLYVTDDRERAEHYAKARTAHDIYVGGREDISPAIFAIEVPDTALAIDDYNTEKEPDQFKLLHPDKYLPFINVTTLEPWNPDKAERLALVSFCIGMIANKDDRKVTKVGKEILGLS